MCPQEYFLRSIYIPFSGHIITKMSERYALLQYDQKLYPNIYVQLHFAATVPITTASVECTFSSLKQLKTYL
ncbi:uncharacterized protein LOC111086519 [Limulus polyphemus]|uniref:Uncharacterized protein LOC111086519 n=1 Tax=Limulus polyphemus TaxID=6850 RepID=A0ABM1SP47_LIMPO|nr:uncharacterized protein LOC111086519 [Limulus polyphemus]